MSESQILLRIERLRQAVARLEEGIDRAHDDLDRDGVIQRFEFSIELVWKTLKDILTYQGIECYAPRSCIKEAFKAGLLEEDEVILDMLEDRNRSSHLYDQQTASAIFERIAHAYAPYLRRLADRLQP